MHRLGRFAAGWLGACFVAMPLSVAQADILITVDKAAQQMTVEIDGATRYVWPVSTGRRGYETPAGNFKPFRLEEDHYSKEWDDAPMPYSIFFTTSGHAIHGSYETRRLGRRASHGCVRLSPKNAAKLFALVKRQGLSNTRVAVLTDPNAPIMARHKGPEQKSRKVQQARKSPPVPAVAATSSAAPASSSEAVYTGGPTAAAGYAPAALPATEIPTASVETVPEASGIN